MARIIDYRVVYAGLNEDLENKVRPLLQEGWQPFGSFWRQDALEAQPMVRYEEIESITQAKLPPGVALASAVIAEAIR